MPAPLSVMVPSAARSAVEEKQWMPGPKLAPLICAPTVSAQAPAPRVVKRETSAAWAAIAAASLGCSPNGGATSEGGKPVIEALGEDPTSPEMTVPAAPAAVTPAKPSTAKLDAAPSDWAAAVSEAQRS